uniref:Uncharacterized protein n=1 Tax=Anguilla anguilla TaxID=7936 RepID=A0A0E9T372_ANGAN
MRMTTVWQYTLRRIFMTTSFMCLISTGS